jgi:DNA-binding GntR family transcriptional regulator
MPGGVSLLSVIDERSPVPFHAQLSAILRGKIASGELSWRVPSINTLAQEYGVSRNTVVHALNTLADEGLIVAVHGKGFYVVERG